jgi:ABC-2 type transport system permease protein
MGKHMGIPGSLPHRDAREGINIQIVFDPVSKPAFRIAIVNALEKFTTRVQFDIIMDRISALSGQADTSKKLDIEKQLRSVGVKEMQLHQQSSGIEKSNSVQHNVPAWAIFGMFFMVIIISENMIAERKGGSWNRLKSIPGPFFHLLMGKMLFYVLLGCVQFALMVFVGVYAMPLLGLDALQLGQAALFLPLIVVSIAVSVVILSAIGGIWVPLEVLPDSLKVLSVLSPMRWSLEGINTLLLRQGSLSDLLMPVSVLMLLSAAAMWMAWYTERKQSGLV